jgi:CRISPR/Cas system CMR subunit Cmr6 (Cas7 group RAMP superfamily)
LNIDELAATDANGLPVIPGTAICGVLKHTFEEETANEFIGYQLAKNGKGSRLIFSDARFVGKQG